MSGIAFNLTGVVDWDISMPFVDLFKQSRPWMLDDFDTPLPDEYKDENGWPTSVPGAFVHTYWGLPAETLYTEGPWLLTWEGAGTFSLTGVSTTSSEAHRIVFTNPGGDAMGLVITATDGGDPLRNFRLVRLEHEELADGGAIFNPRFLQLHRNSGCSRLRFMDWMGTNWSPQSEWSDRPEPNDVTWVVAGGNNERLPGVPVEIMVALANELRVDPWFCFPHLATDEYIEEFATYVRDHLDPALLAHFEYSNETWNGLFAQTGYCDTQGAAAPWTNEVEGVFGQGQQWAGYRMAQAVEIVRDVYGADSGEGWVGVLSTWPISAYNTGLRLQGIAHHISADAGVPEGTTVAKLFSTLAVSTYFGNDLLNDEGGKAALVDHIAAHTDEETFDWITGLMLDPGFTSSVPANAALWGEQKLIADANGLTLSAYEGGTHVLHAFGIGLSPEEQAAVLEVLTAYSYSPQIAQVYDAAMTAWEALGEQPFMEYVAIGAPNPDGAFAAKRSYDDFNNRWAVLMSRGRGLPYRQGYAGVTTRTG